jgi:hypothetical protein
MIVDSTECILRTISRTITTNKFRNINAIRKLPYSFSCPKCVSVSSISLAQKSSNRSERNKKQSSKVSYSYPKALFHICNKCNFRWTREWSAFDKNFWMKPRLPKQKGKKMHFTELTSYVNDDCLGIISYHYI